MSSDKPWLKLFPRSFVAADLVMQSWADIEPYFAKLSQRDLHTTAELEAWLADWSEAQSVVEEFASVRYVEMTCHTDDEDKKNAYLECVREVEPKLIEWENKLDHKYYDSPLRARLNPRRFQQFDRRKKADIELFTEKNIPLGVRLQELSQKYQEVMGAMTVEFEGKERTMPQMAQFMREPDRGLRERAHRASAQRRLVEKEKLDLLFDEMLQVRGEFAANLGLNDYREYCFRSKLRDYTPEDCLQFHESIKNTAVPLAGKLIEKRRNALGLGSVAPWDTECDEKGRPPLKPFTEPEKLAQGVTDIFMRLDPRLGERFDSIRHSMDLDSRKGKAPGGYQTTFSERRIPFIFTNAVGSQTDVNTLLHEGGHAFHTMESRTQPLTWYRHAAMEFSEVASMSMELLGGRELDPFYDKKEERDRARAEHLRHVVDIFGWVAMVDAFQHWLYTHPGHSHAQRDDKWVELYRKFSPEIDWSTATQGALRSLWHRQLHIFEVPFYYIEYAIAQLGALQIYRNYRAQGKIFEEINSALATNGARAILSEETLESIRPRRVVDQYLNALARGGSAPAPDLFEAAAIKFDFSENVLGRLMGMVEAEIGDLG
ncbi:MAG: M3 family oligoendopeptidase [Nitrospinota bacterium]|nr:M3 family oligoendopeptidase [Nitrospinota bacterium]